MRLRPLKLFVFFVNNVIVSSGIRSWLRPLWSPFGDRRVRFRREVLGLCWDGPGPAGLPIAPAL